MAQIDSDLFRDVYTNKQAVPSSESLQLEFKKMDDVKVMRLKSSATWIDYCILTPEEPEWLTKQLALLQDVPVDNLLKSAFNFLDVNDTASVNRINEDLSQTHQRRAHQSLREKSKWSKKIVVSTNDGDKPLRVNLLHECSSMSNQLREHLLGAVSKESEHSKSTKSEVEFSGSLF